METKENTVSEGLSDGFQHQAEKPLSRLVEETLDCLMTTVPNLDRDSIRAALEKSALVDAVRQGRDHLEVVRNQSLTDELTGALNRRGLLQAMERRIYETGRYPYRGFAVVMIDLDGFKDVNDNCGGHQAGDKALIEVTQRLRGVVRRGDIVARPGGDEFAVLMSADSFDGTTFNKASVRDKIRSAFEGLVYWGEENGQAYPIGASIGIVDIYRGASVTGMEALIEEADGLAYDDKWGGFDPKKDADNPNVPKNKRLEAARKLTRPVQASAPGQDDGPG